MSCPVKTLVYHWLSARLRAWVPTVHEGLHHHSLSAGKPGLVFHGNPFRMTSQCPPYQVYPGRAAYPGKVSRDGAACTTCLATTTHLFGLMKMCARSILPGPKDHWSTLAGARADDSLWTCPQHAAQAQLPAPCRDLKLSKTLFAPCAIEERVWEQAATEASGSYGAAGDCL